MMRRKGRTIFWSAPSARSAFSREVIKAMTRKMLNSSFAATREPLNTAMVAATMLPEKVAATAKVATIASTTTFARMIIERMIAATPNR